MSDNKLLQFAPFSSALDAGFWYQLTKRKLDVFMLDDSAVNICGFYSNNGAVGLPPIANIDYSSFDEDLQVPLFSFPLKGYIINTNTLEDFKVKDKKSLLHTFGSKVWDSIKNGTALENPSVMQCLICLTFADLKKYHYYYWVAFPALTYPEATRNEKAKKFEDYFTSDQISQFLKSYDTLSTEDKIAFLVYVEEGGKCCVSKLKEYESLKNGSGQVLLGFADPSTFENHPGWPLRNILSLATYHWGAKQNIWDVVCFREFVKDGNRHFEHSIIITVQLNSTDIPDECPNVVGWEKNQNKLAPRKVDMSANMDPVKLADAAVDLNLKLMRWRLLPELHLEKISFHDHYLW